jgi:Cof subfamily protein (haloacid dehalogenase superfamily)
VSSRRGVLLVRLVALDLDGTLMGRDRVLSPRVRAAVGEALARGVVVTLATGRMYQSTVAYAAALGLRAPLICYQGGYVREMPDLGGRLIYHRPMPAPVAREAIRWSRARGFWPHANIDDRLLVQAGDPAVRAYSQRATVAAEFFDDLEAAISRPATKVLAVGEPPMAEEALTEARAAFEGRAFPTVSDPLYLEFNAPGVSKGRALRWLARRLGIPLAQTVAVGDHINDVEMLTAAGHGVAMAGSPEVVRQVARYVTAALEDDGAAIAIEALVLGRGSLDGSRGSVEGT